MTILAKVLHGSRLYRLDGPTSDTDWKVIHLPPIRDCALMRATRNAQYKTGDGAGKVESESFALQEFLKLAANGEDVAVTMLHCSGGDVSLRSPTWDFLRVNRHRFYTRHMRGQMGFAKSQAVKYAMRADRMAAVEQVIASLEQMVASGVGRLYQAWAALPDGEHIRRVIPEHSRDGVDKRVYEVAGKGLPATITPAYGLEILTKLRDQYGDRVRAARSMDNRDMKSISHSFRVGYQLLGIFQRGGFNYPLPESDLIRAIKEGRASYLDDHLDDKLHALIAEVEKAAEASALPERVDQGWLDEIVLDAYGLS